MARNRKCVLCDDLITDEQGVPYKGRYAHQKCFNAAIKALQGNKIEKISNAEQKRKKVSKAKPKTELKEALSEDEYQNKQIYYHYLKKLIGEEQLSAKIYALSDDYIKRYGFSYEKMYQTLVYLHEIIEKELTDDIVGIIPYYYTEAMQYYDNIKKIEAKNRNIDITHMYKERTIVVQPKKRKIKQLAIETIGKEVD